MDVSMANELPVKSDGSTLAQDSYGYVIRWNGTTTVKLVSQLLQSGFKLRYSTEPFELMVPGLTEDQSLL